MNSNQLNTENKAASHTYDRGYRKWDKYDVQAALDSLDNGTKSNSEPLRKEASSLKFDSSTGQDRPRTYSKKRQTTLEEKTRDVLTREQGNEFFRTGNYRKAIQFYTRSLGYNPRSVSAFANRAMAHLKLGEYYKAEIDCTLALKQDAKHVKSLVRRGLARRALGRHKAACADFSQACSADPMNKATISRKREELELISLCSKSVPRHRLIPRVVNSKEAVGKPNTVEQHTDEILSLTKEQSTEPVRFQLKSQIPALPPRTAYEFCRNCHSLTKQHLDLETYLFKVMAPDDYRRIFSKAATLEGEIVSFLLSAISSSLSSVEGRKTKPELALSILSALAESPGFSFAKLFLNEEDYSNIERIFGTLEREGLEIGSTVQRYRK
eukprot:CAMPEP_0184006704 /NCGR_PEP_ID=MMETSP0954-20121128/857_1 /TAXON_ID=627963 /ORGANISM="Aplanochytrium sp, Strain PBS07" /LENGTH=381 /DNA_ID=CAMNT_0026285315 /DNA_START=164 /DNA_END=1309 /DNA_ORIENTATION=-